MKWLVFIIIWVVAGFVGDFISGLVIFIYKDYKGYDPVTLDRLGQFLTINYLNEKVCGSFFRKLWYGYLCPLVFWPIQIYIFVKMDVKAMRMIDEQKTES